MRLAGVFLAILLIAACPPRRARVVYAVPARPAPIQPAVPVMPQPTPPGPIKSAKVIDPDVERHLSAWEKKVNGLTNLYAEISLQRKDAALKRETNYKGVVLYLKPNYFVLRLDNTADPKKLDYEAYICAGKALYAYDGMGKKITEFALPPRWPLSTFAPTENPLFELFLNVKSKEVTERFDVAVFKEDEHYVYLDIKPISSKDRAAFSHLRLALYRPGPKSANFAYLPAQAAVLLPGGDSQIWKFTSPQVDILHVRPENFKFEPIKGWVVQKVPAAAPAPDAGKP